jgi:hypothetical protein
MAAGVVYLVPSLHASAHMHALRARRGRVHLRMRIRAGIRGKMSSFFFFKKIQ